MKRRIVYIIIVVALLLSCLSMGGCRNKGKRIAFFVYDGEDTFISEMMQYMTENVPADIAFEIREAGNSQAVQNQQVLELIDSGGYSLFIINAVDRLACSSIVEKCALEGIPIIFFNREPLGDALASGNVFYVGADADSLGRRQADVVGAAFGGDYSASGHDINGDGTIQLAILKGEQGHQDAEKRTENCVAQLKNLGYKVEVLAIEVADWNRQDGYNAMQKLYKQCGSSIELVFSNNDDMALGAIDFLIDEGVFSRAARTSYRQPFLIVGVDGTAVGLEAIAKGHLYATVNNDSIKQSDAILSLADYILNDKNLSSFSYTITNGHYIYIDGEIITLSNLADYTN